MTDAPCGCDLIHESTLTRDKRVRARKLADGEHFQQVWKCPRRPGAPEQPEPITDPAAKQALEWVEQLTGAEELCTCPLYFARLDWVAHVLRLRRWFKTGQLGLRMPHPPAVIVDAIDCIEDSVMSRETWEIQRAMEERPRNPRQNTGLPAEPTPPKL